MIVRKKKSDEKSQERKIQEKSCKVFLSNTAIHKNHEWKKEYFTCTMKKWFKQWITKERNSERIKQTWKGKIIKI